MKRSRGSRRRGHRAGSRWPALTALVIIAVLVTAVSVLPAASVTHADVPRPSGADTVGDTTAVHGLDTASDVHINSTDVLTNVTNRFGRALTVTVTLRNDSDHIGDLVVGGTNVGNQTSFTLNNGETKVVSIRIPNDDSLTDEVVYFHVETSGPGIAGNTPDRNVPVNA